MRQIMIAAILTLLAAAPGGAVEFLGVELCTQPVNTRVILPADSPLSLESVEVGKHGGLVMLLHSKKGAVLGQVDDLMTSFTGSGGTGDERKLEWSGNQITAFAQVIKKGYVALAVTAAKDCTAEPEAAPVAAATEGESAAPPDPAQTADPAPVVAAAVAVTVVEEVPEADPPAAIVDFELKGRLKHATAEDGWVDVMGVVVNNTGSSYTVASFDLSLYDDMDELICVDTVSVNQLKEGQERAFRGAIRCADYGAEDVASWKLQFAGGH